jgi:hypothetical protein
MSLIYEIFEIFYSKATVASPIPNFLEEENAPLDKGANFYILLNI